MKVPKKVTTLVLPVGGMGKRMLPLTLRTPKALVRLCGKPLLDYILEEAALSGIRDVVLVINPQHAKHFARYARSRRKAFPRLRFHTRFQSEPLGNGHAILQAADILLGKPFAVRFCDDLVPDTAPVLHSLIRLYEAYRAPVLLLGRVRRSDIQRYGIVGVRRERKKSGLPEGNVYRLTEIIEKPHPKRAPSNLFIIGGYILTPEILRNLKKISDSLPHPGNDALPLAVALQVEFIVGGRVYGWEFAGKRLDCGTIEGLRSAEKALCRTR
ncbi:hypothetical protein C4587_02205 [Candidatus Parcubacteria bacterium]|nr:MAG: hypothetical protein C4587_02205 [Candidatus Parcubacteria bacterium]